jgi:phosphatidylglycerophosphatase A
MQSIEKARSRLWNTPSEKIRDVPFLALLAGSFFFVGLSPLSSGTIGSAVAAILYYTLPVLQINGVLIGLCFVCFAVGMFVSDIIVLRTGEHDAGIIVIDEVLGQWVSLLTLWYYGDLVFVIAAFVLFRFFDIMKVYPASHFERAEGGTSIMLDDVVAGIYANIGAHLFTYGYYTLLT